ncbi:MAG: hydroxyectoine utilization dehydratase EutB, partial [Alphaproteobacteria bacterium]|nr:hydroxyectoine utilization dehydratase EutB [Alphaproteobacteria bacterium]
MPAPQPAPLPVTLQDVYRARARIAGGVRATPLVRAEALSAVAGADVFLKLDSLQETGSFKLRGATNRLARLTEAERAAGVVAVSTGNHGRAVAFAARRLGIPATVFLSELVPANKVAALEALGATVVVGGASQDAAFDAAHAHIAGNGGVLVPPFDDPAIVAGQGTLGLEVLDALPDIDTALVPLSGGGLIAGIAVALKAANPAIRIVGLSMDRGAAMIESLRAGRPVAVEEVESLADSLGGGIGLDNRVTFPLVQSLVDDVVTVTEDEIARGMAHLYWHDRQVAEGAGAVAHAALLAGKAGPLGARVCAFVCGSNVDMPTFTKVVTEHAPEPFRHALITPTP